ncbi:aldehyde dehydrogenase (NADP(+)) [Undibacterium fentianense]|uniref:2,5-dioxovalerate dehydrogenase n=1 Tax=Undibacterium fentianense TaxID=2828728 RepID=A0A941E197_9BURK|nr:aldehyde dehydrogenase (NADP(+)) [Undibacterium fentianense]MBR7799521.1 aldehyde dehydrogenase (NADP(+)) [Undibacterium fentianense]
MKITGSMVIGQQTIFGSAGTIKAINPATNSEFEPAFGLATKDDVDQACQLAAATFDSYRETTPEKRASFLEKIADNILALGNTLIERAHQETGLPIARLEGERGRTMNQLRLFAKVVRDGAYLSATLDSALPERVPPRPDLRMRKIGLGPVAVFGASNFPLAFSVAGGDTASALAAGCPVVVKAHSAHLGTSELVGKAIQQAANECGLAGVFSMLIGDGRQIGQSLVAHPAIKAVGFTGSRQGGMALVRTAAARAEPIPVYAEMSSINPVFLLPDALKTKGAAIAQGFADSLTMGAGQFCTNPGMLIALESPELQSFIEAATAALQVKPAATMLTPGIHQAYSSGVERLNQVDGVEVVAQGLAASTPCAAQANLAVCLAKDFLSNSALHDEVFGPSSLLIRCKDLAEMQAIAEHIEGQLTATVHATSTDYAIAKSLLPSLERKAGRILFNGFPTGVEVCHAMVHGGPFPSTSDSRSTSVGATAIDRFLRPVCYQEFPADLLPTSLQDANPFAIPRVINGELTVPAK